MVHEKDRCTQTEHRSTTSHSASGHPSQKGRTNVQRDRRNHWCAADNRFGNANQTKPAQGTRIDQINSQLLVFEHLADEAAQFTYVQRLWHFFRSLFAVSFSKIFELFKIEEESQSCFQA